MGSSSYYLALTAASLAVGIYNFSSGSAGTSLKCFTMAKMDNTTFQAYKSSFGNVTIEFTPPANASDPNALYSVRQPSGGNTLSLIATVTAILYLCICGLSIFNACMTNWMSNLLPEDFMKIGRCKSCLAAFCKILPILIILIHWLIMILIIIIWILLITKACEVSTTSVPGVLIDPGKYYKDMNTLNIVNSCLWVLIHCGGSIVREIVYQEPFIYWPSMGKSAFATFMFKT
jgi:hypothetical protein